MEEHFAFFEEAMTLCSDTVHGCISARKNRNFIPTSSTRNKYPVVTIDSICTHSEYTEENGKETCLDCGNILHEKFITTPQCSILGKQRKKRDCSIYNSLPTYLSHQVKDLTVIIYKYITPNKIYRNTLKQVILLACLHRAAAICNTPYSFEDLLGMFLVKANEANKGFAFLANNLPKDCEYVVPFNNDKEEELSIKGILNNLHMIELEKPIFKLFKLVKTKSDILDVSLCKSVVCGCVYFWIRFTHIPKILKIFAQDVEMSAMTILNKYLIISEVVYKSILKQLFSILLQNCKRTVLVGKNRYKQTLKINKSALYGPEMRVFIQNPFLENEISVVSQIPKVNKNYRCPTSDNGHGHGHGGGGGVYSEDQREYNCQVEPFIYPLDNVDDIKEWNLLLDKRYYNYEGEVFILQITILKNTRDLVFDFSKYNKANNIKGELLLKDIVNKFLSDNNG